MRQDEQNTFTKNGKYSNKERSISKIWENEKDQKEMRYKKEKNVKNGATY